MLEDVVSVDNQLRLIGLGLEGHVDALQSVDHLSHVSLADLHDIGERLVRDVDLFGVADLFQTAAGIFFRDLFELEPCGSRLKSRDDLRNLDEQDLRSCR